MRSSAPAGRFHGNYRQRSTDTAGLPGSGRSRAGSEEPATATLASLQKEITLLQQTTETLRELAHTQKATNRRLSNAKDPAQRLIAEPLTRTEEAVLRRLTTTLSLREISRERNVSRDTIKGQARAIYRKLGVSGRHEAVQRARELGILTRRKMLGSVC